MNIMHQGAEFRCPTTNVFIKSDSTFNLNAVCQKIIYMQGNLRIDKILFLTYFIAITYFILSISHYLLSLCSFKY